MEKTHAPSGRNCSYFPIVRGRLKEILRRYPEDTSIVYKMPRSFYAGKGCSRLFFLCLAIGMLLFAAGTMYFNNTDADIADYAQNPHILTYLITAGIILILPFIVTFLVSLFRGVHCAFIDGVDQHIKFGRMTGKKWSRIDYDYTFGDLIQIEVLRNHEMTTPRTIPMHTITNTRSRVLDSYELNLYFRPDNRWIGITESHDRQKILRQAEDISRMTAAPISEETTTRQRVATKDSGEASVPLQEADTDIAPMAAHSLGAAIQEADISSLPPFFSEEDREPVDSIEVFPAKLKRKGFPFKFKATDQLGQKLSGLLAPVVSHFVNTMGYEKSLSALELLCSGRNAGELDRQELVSRIVNTGWHGEEELLSAIAGIFDGQTGSSPMQKPSRDVFERYYMQLNESLYVLGAKYRIVLIEYLEKIIQQAPDRFSRYELQPERLAELQQSGNYAFKFILDVAAVVICGGAIVLTVFLLSTGIGWGEPGMIARGFFSALITIGLIYGWRKVRKRFGKRN